jgi:hypothetical protein
LPHELAETIGATRSKDADTCRMRKAAGIPRGVHMHHRLAGGDQRLNLDRGRQGSRTTLQATPADKPQISGSAAPIRIVELGRAPHFD